MGSIDIIKTCVDAIRQVSDDVADAVVYLDSGCLEAFQLIGAFSIFLEIGARAVCSLENMSSLDVVTNWKSTSFEPATKMAVFTTRLLSDAHRYILRCLGTHQTIADCRIFTSIPEVSHSAYAYSPLGPDAFREYESLLLMDYEELLKLRKVNKVKPSTDNARVDSPLSHPENWSIKSVEDNSPAVRLNISVCHFPMVVCSISRRFFILPSEGAIAEASLSDQQIDSVSPGLPIISTGQTSDFDDIPPGATLTAHFLYYFAAKMDLKLEIFSFGDLSRSIGKILTNMSSLYDVGRNKKSAGLLIVDRTVDLFTPCCHGDSAFDWMLSSLPRMERKVNSSSNLKRSLSTLVKRPRLDARVPLGKVLEREDKILNNITAFISGWSSCDVRVSGVVSGDNEEFLKGFLASVDNYKGTNYLEALLERGIKEGAMLVKKWILGVIREEKVSVTIKNRLAFPSSSELLSITKLLTSNESLFIKNRGIIQLAVASCFALSEPFNSKWNALSSAERVLKMSYRDSSQSLSNQVRDIIDRSVVSRSNGPNLFSFKDSLLLTIIGYILAGENLLTSGSSSPFSWKEEHSLKESLTEAIFELPEIKDLTFLRGLEEELETHYRTKNESLKDAVESFTEEDLDDNWESWGEDQDSDQNNEQEYRQKQIKLEVRDRVDQLFKIFHKMSGLRQKNAAVKYLENRFNGESSSSKGLLYKILLMLLEKYDVPGVEYHSSAVGRILKSGLGRFGLGQAKPNLGDQSVIIVFVVGGVNGLEIQEMQEAVSESGRPDMELLAGGTTLLTPDDMFDLILGSSSYI